MNIQHVVCYVNPSEERNGNLVIGRVVDGNTRLTNKKIVVCIAFH